MNDEAPEAAEVREAAEFKPDPALLDTSRERLSLAIVRYEKAVAQVWTTRLSYFVDGDIALAFTEAGSALAQFQHYDPSIDRPALDMVEPALRGANDDEGRKAFVAAHQANIDALHAFIEAIGEE